MTSSLLLVRVRDVHRSVVFHTWTPCMWFTCTDI